ncbi:hypothetical protein pdam_00023555 [Pocillopora damicornis]|uniref:Uncharacterized protein n=1 Tax=Pocillopora damicornis TaxID=46731 RepID=A0A3M6UYW3_POCDA|nr:hypothetical protein pdam_00023555 [Pocillopora damicornis]
MRQINRLLLLVSVGFILAKGFVLQDGENSTEIEKGVFDLKAAEAESFIEQSSLDAVKEDRYPGDSDSRGRQQKQRRRRRRCGRKRRRND